MEEVRSQLKSGHAKEHAYRPALQRLMRQFSDVEAINDPARSEHGAPDFIFQRKSNRDIILGYAEAKDISGVNLDKVESSNQMRRYAGYQNLFLTNYLEFRFYRNGDKYRSVRIGAVTDGDLSPNPDEYARLIAELRAFLALPPQKIGSGKRLAEIMGAKARRIRDDVETFLTNEAPPAGNELVKIFKLMRSMLVHDLDHSRFADMYAQTLVYGLFVARYGDTTPDSFDREEARTLIPRTNPFLRQFFDHIAGVNFDDRLARAVDELCQVFQVSDVRLLVQRHLHSSGGERTKDPIIHFYEDFLQSYDPAVRKKMGAYYTPLPVVDYMVRRTDELLKEEFGIQKGLSDTTKIKKNHRTYLTDIRTGELTRRYKDELVEYHKVQILDPAVGTATFLNQIIRYIHAGFKGQEGRWPKFVKEDLISRLNGFELMMAPYTIAHLKLGMTFEELGATDLGDRLGVYLTNTLEEGVNYQADLFSIGLAEAVTEESQAAGRIKTERPVMVIIGNPPYSGESSNKTEYADSLLDKYRVEPGGTSRLAEQNSKWLTDDYVKFIAFAEDMIARNGEGVVAMITNHGYLNNPTFRGMRWRLARTFDRIEVLDLHGNKTKREVAPDGSADENVFDIRTGVSIIFAVRRAKRNKSGFADVHFAEAWGPRERKFELLRGNPEFAELPLNKKSYLFSPRDDTDAGVYESGVLLSELFLIYATGVVTKNDRLALAMDEPTLETVVGDFRQLDEHELRSKYAIKPDTRDWVLKKAIADVRAHQSGNEIVDYAYRPFDTRKLFFSGKPKGMVAYTQMKVMGHMLRGSNVAIISGRQGQAVGMMPWNLAFVTDKVSDLNIFYRGGGSVFPLQQVHSGGSSTSNLSPTHRKILVGDIGPVEDEEIFDYTYGVLYSPSYRTRFREFLKSDFPRVPVPSGRQEFDRVKMIGRELRDLHLLSDQVTVDIQSTYPIAGDDRVTQPRYLDSNVFINETQYFGGVPERVWAFYIGGYQPAQKWLKDRKGRVLNNEDLEDYQRILTVLGRTIELMERLEHPAPSWADAT